MRPAKTLLFSTLLIAAAPADLGLRGLQQEDQRIASIAYQLMSANAPLCSKKVPLAGFTIHDLNQYAPNVRAEAARVFGLSSGPAILAVAAGSPAARAGLRPNDMIASVGAVALASGQKKKQASFDSVQAAESVINRALANPPIKVGRADHPVVSFRPDIGCASQVQVMPGRKLNASADGETIQITTALIAFAGNDDAVATVLAHELAHNVLEHRKVIKSKSLTTKETETEADYWGMYFLVRAGFDGNRAIDFWDRYEAKTNKGWLADGTHPGKKERLRFVRRVLADIREEQKGGKPLIPTPMIFNTTR
jgi:beta-barrel assembly-enhancing protease